MSVQLIPKEGKINCIGATGKYGDSKPAVLQ